MEDQMGRLLASGKAVTGYHSLLFTNGAAWWRYEGQVFSGILGARTFGVFGTSLLYRKDWWRAHPFIDGPKNFDNHEDKAFVLTAIQANQLVEAPCGDHMYARIHADNTSPKGTGDHNRYRPVAIPAFA
jgi:hypothetical protein